MLGIIFSEFMDMVEDNFADQVFDDLLEYSEKNLPSGGEYTSVGKYNHEEILQLIGKLSALTNIDPHELTRTYGKHLFSRFFEKYPDFFMGVNSSFEMLKTIENHIHVEVRKLYPDAELPTLTYSMDDDKKMTLTYQSKRPFAILAHGLIEGCVAHFKEEIEINYIDLSTDDLIGAKFELVHNL